MANALYPKGKQAFLSGSIDMTTATIKIAMATNGYTYNGSHQFYSDITPGSNVVGTPQTLGSISVTSGVFNAANPSFTGLSSSSTIQAFVIYKDTGVSSTSPLIAYIDTGTGLPIVLTTAITEVDVTFDTGSNKIFAL